MPGGLGFMVSMRLSKNALGRIKDSNRWDAFFHGCAIVSTVPPYTVPFFRFFFKTDFMGLNYSTIREV